MVAAMRKPIILGVGIVTAAVAAWAVWRCCFHVEPDPRLRELLPGTWQAADFPMERAPIVIEPDGRYQWPRTDTFRKDGDGNAVPDLRAVVKGRWKWVGKDAIELDGGGEAKPETIYLDVRDKGDSWELAPGHRRDGPHQYWTGLWVRKK
jgi:hypothetical protein